MNTDGMAVWVFDSACVLCDAGVRYTLRNERAATIRFVSIQSEVGRQLAIDHGIDPDDPNTFLFIDGGKALEKSEALIALSRHLKGPARLTGLMRVLPRGMRDAAYGIVARHRYRVFGRTNTCILPDSAVADRFIL